jgi:hypothetical protein
VLALLLLAGLFSLLLSVFGVMAYAWTDPVTILTTLLWLIPIFAFPIFLLRLFWKGMPKFIFWIAFGCQFVDGAWFNLLQCAAGKCTTTNPFLIVLSSFVIPPVFGWLLVASSMQFYESLRRSVDLSTLVGS